MLDIRPGMKKRSDGLRDLTDRRFYITSLLEKGNF